ncbi:MAG: hypothetical protein QF878_10525, partial [SAR202 cluster bacterium]|nr:hypothetical protein [SAR202 cluster bacterium]
MIWLITAVVDECDPDCENPDSVTTTAGIIQTYYEKFHLTGFSVGEQHGMDSLVIAQTDAVSATYENYLWHLIGGLEQAFIGPELVDGNRFDLFQIENRFDNNSVAGDLDPRRWGIPKSKLDVTSFSATDSNIGSNDLVNNGIESILTDNYGKPTTDTQVTLLFAREDTLRLTALDDSDAVTEVGSKLSVDLGSLGLQTFASMNWSPYIYDGLSWVSDDLTEYLGHLDTQMNLVIDVDDILAGEQPTDAAQAKEGAVAMAKSYYMANYKGSSNLVEFAGSPTGESAVDDQALTLPDGEEAVALILADMTELFVLLLEDETTIIIDNVLVANNAASGVTVTAAAVLEDLGNTQNAFAGAAIGQTSSVSSLSKKLYKKLAKIEGTSPRYAKYAKKGALVAGTLAMGGLAVAIAVGLDDDSAFIWLYSTNLAIEGVHLYAAFGKKSLFKAAEAINTPKMNLLSKNMTKVARVGAVAGLLFDVGIAIVLFAIQSADVEPGSLAHHALIATLAATIIVAVILAVLSASVVGLVIVSVLLAIDALVGLICHLAGVDQGTEAASWGCGGITGALTKAITFLIHDQYIVPDLEDEDRLDVTLNSPTTIQNGANQGFVAGNSLSIAGEVENTISLNSVTGMGSAGVAAADAIIDFLGGGSTLDSLLGRSAFDYALQSSEADHHSGLAQVTLDWTNNTEVFQIEGLFPLSGPGINQNQSIVLSESLNVPVIECWGFIVQYCEVDKLKDTFHSSLSDSFSFDVLPTSLNGFVNLAGGANGYRMSWDSRFPILVDADGDGLPSRASGGSDPDDGDWDTDDDGLSDYWETNNGFDPTSDDPDGDLLTDYWEAFYGTDQLRTDSDADGLVDGEEFFHSGATHPFGDDGSTWTGGWTIVYEYDSTDEPQRTLVSADALDYDGDQDTIIDKLEKVYRYNPNVSDELNVLSLQADIQSPDSALEGYVAPGAAVSYTATVKNELDIPTARGLLESEFPVDVEQTTQTFVLASREEITLTDDALTAP